MFAPIVTGVEYRLSFDICYSHSNVDCTFDYGSRPCFDLCGRNLDVCFRKNWGGPPARNNLLLNNWASQSQQNKGTSLFGCFLPSRRSSAFLVRLCSRSHSFSVWMEILLLVFAYADECTYKIWIIVWLQQLRWVSPREFTKSGSSIAGDHRARHLLVCFSGSSTVWTFSKKDISCSRYQNFLTAIWILAGKPSIKTSLNDVLDKHLYNVRSLISRYQQTVLKIPSEHFFQAIYFWCCLWCTGFHGIEF